MIAETVDPKTGDLPGNIPQGVSHLALTHAAIPLDGGLRTKEADRR